MIGSLVRKWFNLFSGKRRSLQFTALLIEDRMSLISQFRNFHRSLTGLVHPTDLRNCCSDGNKWIWQMTNGPTEAPYNAQVMVTDDRSVNTWQMLLCRYRSLLTRPSSINYTAVSFLFKRNLGDLRVTK